MSSGVERGAEPNVHERDTQSCGKLFLVLRRLKNFSANAGEKKGFTVTILLGLIVYIDYVQTAIPVWPRTRSKYQTIFFF